MEYSALVRLYASLEGTTKRLEKTKLLSDTLKILEIEDLERVVHLVQGTVFPPWSDQKVGVAEKLVIKAMQLSFGEPAETIEKKWRESGDLGDVAKEISAKKKQATLFSMSLSVKKVFENIEKLSTLEGAGTVDRKVQLMSELLTSASPSESRYLVRTFLGQLRAGLGEGTVRDAIVWAFLLPLIPYDSEKNDLALTEDARKEYDSIVDKVQQAFDVVTDLSEIAVLVKVSGIEGLGRVSLQPGRPVKVMLFQKVRDVEEALTKLGAPAFFEYKYDGFRMQIHKDGGNIKIFTRRLENVTSQFPDVVARVGDLIKEESFIIDAEAIGIDLSTNKYLPFQRISQRIRRKYGIEDMAKNFPVEVRVFDILFLNGNSTINKQYSERRELVEKTVPDKPGLIAPATMITSSDKDEARRFYETALSLGMEGVMGKKSDAPYQPGSRVGFGVKIKPVMDTLDLVVVKAEWGEGKRAGWMTSFTLACQDEDGNLLEIGNVGTGFKEKKEEGGTTFEEMTEMLKPLIIEEKGREARVNPKIVLEIKFEEIQKSPTYSSGYALRFPRLVQVRADKPAEEASTLTQIEDQYDMQM